MRGPLPVYIDDPVKRLDVVKKEMGELKESKQALGAEVISRFNDFAPPTLLAQASRINFSTRLFNLIVTNVPGPQLPLYVLGRELEDAFPVAFLPSQPRARDRDHELQRRHRTSGCSATTTRWPDIDVIAEGVSEALSELMIAANQAETSGRAVAAG